MKINRKFIFAVILGFFVLFSGLVTAISRGYLSDDRGLKPGMAVKISQENQSEDPKVERADKDEVGKLLGIATTVEDSSVTIASGNQSVYVETSGEVDAFVTDITGTIKSGDKLTISPLNGILSKANEDAKIIVGISLSDFPLSEYESHQIDTAEGKKTAKVAKVRINIDQKSLLGGSKVDSSLERLGRSVVGKNVSEIRMVISLVMFFLVLFAEGAILYGAISSSITSLGRNPLAKDVIRKQLIQVVLIAIVVLALGLGAIYLVLWV